MRLIMNELEEAQNKYEKEGVLSSKELIEIEQGIFLLLQEEEEWLNLFPFLMKLPYKESAHGLFKAWIKKDELSRRKLIYEFMKSQSYTDYQGIERILCFVVIFSEEKSDAALSFLIDICKRLTEKGTVLPNKQDCSLIYEALIASTLYKNIEIEQFALNKQELLSLFTTVLVSLFSASKKDIEEIAHVLQWLSGQPQKTDFPLSFKKELLKEIADWPEECLNYLEKTNLVEKYKKDKSKTNKTEPDIKDLIEQKKANDSPKANNFPKDNVNAGGKRSLSVVLKELATEVIELEEELENMKRNGAKETERLKKEIERIGEEKRKLEDINRKLQERLSLEREKNQRFDLLEGSGGQLSALQVSMGKKRQEQTKQLFKDEIKAIHQDYLAISDEEMSKGIGEVCRSILKKLFTTLEEEDLI